MATAKDIIEVALRYVGEVTNFTEFTDSELKIPLDKLNQLVERYRGLGLNLNSSQAEISTPNSIVNYPNKAAPALESNLAKDIWILYNFDRPIPAWLVEQAETQENELFTLYGADVGSVFPGNLPKGTGNYEYNTSRFYPDCDENPYACNEDQIETETSVPIVTE